MDKHLSPNESQLFDLLHTKNFSDLNSNDKTFVLKQTTQKEYELERQIILTAPQVFEGEETAKPLPLIIPTSKGVLLTNMPLYKTLLAVAATVIFMLLIFPIHKYNDIVKTKTEYIVKTDTIEIEKQIYLHDTIYQTIEKPIYIETQLFAESNPCVKPIDEAPRLLNSSSSLQLPELTTQIMEGNGKSLKDDNLSSLIVEF